MYKLQADQGKNEKNCWFPFVCICLWAVTASVASACTCTTLVPCRYSQISDWWKQGTAQLAADVRKRLRLQPLRTSQVPPDDRKKSKLSSHVVLWTCKCIQWAANNLIAETGNIILLVLRVSVSIWRGEDVYDNYAFPAMQGTSGSLGNTSTTIFIFILATSTCLRAYLLVEYWLVWKLFLFRSIQKSTQSETQR
jgi:hypothetical protein